MLSKEEIKNRNLLENADFAKRESKQIADFLEIECDKCKNKIKFKLKIKDIENVEKHIEQLETTEQKLIEKLIEYKIKIHRCVNETQEYHIYEEFYEEVEKILKGENNE